MSKAVLVYGIGISGCGAADILARQGKRVLLYNDAGHEVDADLKELLAKSGGQIVIGKKEGLLDDVEEVILSPGISMENPLVQEALNRGINVTGEAELAYRNYNGHIVGITGTNGKTTTTILIGEMLATSAWRLPKKLKPCPKIRGWRLNFPAFSWKLWRTSARKLPLF